MRFGLNLAIVLALALSASGCGGSSSETPWPAEPEGKTLGPSGEKASPSDLDNIRGRDPDAGVENVVEP
jgi:hypothetical protein